MRAASKVLQLGGKANNVWAARWHHRDAGVDKVKKAEALTGTRKTRTASILLVYPAAAC